MTSSKYLRSGLRKSIAFPIMLAAVGLLLASLVLGLGSNLARALGNNDAGICGYSELIRDAILANNELKSFNCDDARYTTAEPADGVWGGADSDDAPNDLDLTAATSFAPGQGELDGFIRGSRVDLRGTGLGVADLDIGDARKTHDAATRAYTNFGDSVKGNIDAFGAGTTADAGSLGLTFLLDGGSTTNNGLALEEYEGTESEVVWVTFEYGEPHKDFKHQTERETSVWMRVDVTITHDDRNDTADSGTSSVVSIMVNSSDAEGTLYAVPFLLPDDWDIERTESEDISIVYAAGGNFGTARGDTTVTALDAADYTFTADKFNDSLPRKGDEADLSIIDEDTPAVPVPDRQDAIADPITDFFTTLSAKNIGVDHLAGQVVADDSARADDTTPGLVSLVVGKAADSTDDAVTSISTSDLSGLTGLTHLNLSGNEIAELPAGIFAEVGTTTKTDLSTRIDLTGEKMGPTGEGFMLDNLGAGGEGLVGGQYLVVERPYNDDRIGFIQDSYEATEGGALVIDINIRNDDDNETVNPGLQFLKVAGDSGALDGDHPDVSNVSIDLNNNVPDTAVDLTRGNYRIAIQLPENKDEDGDNTLHLAFGYLNTADPAVLTTLLDIVPVTIRDASYEAMPPAPTVPESSFESVVVTQNEFVEAPGNEDLKHNISNFTVTIGGNAVSANFLDVYNATGGLERWGYPTSEVVEIPGIGLTQFFQRGALHLESNANVTRLLAWDYVGGGLGGSTDQGVEAAPDAGPEGGEQVGDFGHYVANVDADGNATGFLDFFNRLGGVAAFGFPKTEARADTGADGTLMEPGTTAGFTRQYFQAAVFQLAEDGSVQLTLLGDTLRGILVPGYADIDAFGAADALSVGDEVSPPVIDS
ncbi:MAG: leucine-rich repeat domain-containing protein [Chloroflexota bacterium]|nr:leucine-rich repeat domain-containing protein [Chloroflexota bacterium]